jgi:hypothetical protein
MKRAASILIAMAFAAGIGLYAVPMTVTWADGKVERKSGSAWAAVNVGDQIDSSSTIRLGKGASVELKDGARKITLTAEGSYLVDSLLKKGAVASKKNTAAMDKLGKLVDPQASVGSTTVAAVRGAAIEPAKESMDWQSDAADLPALMEEGRRLVREGDYQTAALRFGEVAEQAEGSDKDAAQYSQAWALAAGDGQARAVKILRSMPSTGNWAGPRALLLARLDIDSGAKAEAKLVIQSGMSAKLFVSDEAELAKSLLDEASAE